MKKINPVLHSLGHAVLVLLYTAGVAWLMFNSQRLFGDVHTFVGPLAALMLLVFSATIVGTLVLGRPIILYLNGSKSEGLRFLGYTIGWMFILVILVFLLYIRWQ